jgi:cobalt-zinc-cadmium efflux system membrane fusion protein
MTLTRSQIAGAALGLLLAGAGGYALASFSSDRSSSPEPASSVAQREEGGADHAGDALQLSPEVIRGAGIIVTRVEAGGLAAELLAPAVATAPTSGQAVLTARAAGAVTRISAQLGDTVRPGQVLAVVESRDAAQIAADRSAALARASLARQTLQRERTLYEQKVTARADYELAQSEAAVAEAEARRASAAAGAAGVSPDGRAVVVTSPIAGQITAVPATLGAFVQPETELFRIADPRRIQVEASVKGSDAGRIAAGDRALLELADGTTIEARVRSVTSALDSETRAATAVLVPVGGTLRLGQTLRARLFPARSGGSSAIVVPEDAVQSLEGRSVVFVRTADGFKPVTVTTGARSAGRIEIVSGLAPGASIATSNAFVLKAEMAKGEGEDH